MFLLGEAFHKEGLEIAKSLNDDYRTAKLQYAMAKAYIELQKYDKAAEMLLVSSHDHSAY